MNLLWIFTALVLALLGWHFSSLRKLAQLRAKGLYPQPGQASMADVERLLQNGMRAWAVRCYREVHGCSLRQASEAVQTISSGQR